MKPSVIKDILLLYDLALMPGKSLDFEENCEHFLKLLMSKKDLDSCWVYLKQDDTNTLKYSMPRTPKKSLSTISNKQIENYQGESISFNVNLEDSDSWLLPEDIQDGCITVFVLEEVGLLITHSKDKEGLSSKELFQLDQVVSRFARSIKACLIHEQSVKDRNQLRILFDSHPLPMVIYRAIDKRIIAVNDTAIDYYGYSKEELLSKRTADLNYNEEEKEKYQSSRSIKEWKHKLNSGKIVDVEITENEIDYEGERSFLALIKDITGRKKAQNVIKTLSKIPQENPNAVLRFSIEENDFTYFNKSGSVVISYLEEVENIEGKSNFLNLIKRAFKDDKIANIEIEMTGKSYIFNAVPISSDSYVNVYGTEITEIKNAHLAVERSEEKYRGIIENLELGLLEVNTVGEIMKVYPQFCEMTGYIPEDLIGKSAVDALLPPEFKAVLAKQSREREEGIPGVYEVQIMKKDGSRIWVIISGAPFYDEYDNIAGSIGIHLDISKRKEMEKDLYLAKEAAENSMKAKEIFMANMSHEIRTPMNAIIGMGGLLRKTGLDTTQMEYLEAIQISADNLLVIINDILDFSKIESGNLIIEKVEFSLQKIIDKTYRIMKLKAEEKGILLYYSIEDSIHDTVLGDPTRLGQVILNLMSNAVKFTDFGSVLIFVKKVEEVGNRTKIMFSVKDSGIGIAADKLDSIFNSFTQEENSTTRKYGGTGLGLAISKKIVEQMGGQLDVMSQKGHGSEFYFTLEFDKGSGEIVPEIGEEIIQIENFKRKKILLVEDNAINRFMATTLLQQWNCVVDHAEDGLIAIEKLKEKPYDLVFMDMLMPNMNGIDATIVIRKELKLTVPIIALTANAINGESEKCAAVGMNDYLSKPFDPKDLNFKMAKWLDIIAVKDDSYHVKEEEFIHEASMSNQLYDLTLLEKVASGNKDFIGKMIEIFLEETPRDMDELKDAVECKNYEQIRTVVHRIKPSMSHVAQASVLKIVNEIGRDGITNNELVRFANELIEHTEILLRQLGDFKIG